jgi:protease PrsW
MTDAVQQRTAGVAGDSSGQPEGDSDDARAAAGRTPGADAGGTQGIDGEHLDDAPLWGGERLLRHAVTRVGPRVWLWLSLLAGSQLLGFPVALAFIAAGLDALLFLSVVWQVDFYEEEPWRLIERTFFWGALPAITLAVIGEVLFHGPARFLVGSAQTRWFEAGFVAPVVEELCKGAGLLSLFRRHREEFDGMLDGLLYGALVGLGFSMTENVVYFLRVQPEHLQGMITTRGLLFGMNHACFSASFGFGLGVACEAASPTLRRWAPVAGLVGAMGLHMANNLTAMALRVPLRFAAFGLAGCSIFIWFRLVAFARSREARWIDAELAEEVQAGIMSADEAAAISDAQMRKAARAAALEERAYGAAHTRLRFYALATDLAFAKHHARINGGPTSAARIDTLRREIAQVRMKRQVADWISGDVKGPEARGTASGGNG